MTDPVGQAEVLRMLHDHAPTDEQRQAFQQILVEADQAFEQQAQACRPTAAVLNFVYSI